MLVVWVESGWESTCIYVSLPKWADQGFIYVAVPHCTFILEPLGTSTDFIYGKLAFAASMQKVRTEISLTTLYMH